MKPIEGYSGVAVILIITAVILALVVFLLVRCVS